MTTTKGIKRTPVTIEDIQKASELLKQFGMPKYPSISDHIYTIACAYREQLIKNVLQKHLGREATEDDAKLCTIKYFEDSTWFLFEYNDKLLGRIDVKWDTSPIDFSRVLSYTFTPLAS